MMLNTSTEFAALAEALSKAQGAFPAIRKERTAEVTGTSKSGAPVSYSYGYADLADILEAIRKPLADNGLSVVQPICPGDGDRVWLLTRLLHSSGQWIESTYPLEFYEKPQETGSAITYARRYALTALLALAPEEDDDGQQAQRSSPAPRAPARACPQCGKTGAVIKGKEEFGGGWLCFGKKGGCGAKWQDEPGHATERPAVPSETPACAHCGSINVKPDPKAPGWLMCNDCAKGTKRG